MLNNYLKSYEDRRAFFFSFLAFLQASLMASSLGELGSQLCFCIQCAASPHAWQPLEHSFHLLMIHLLGAGAAVEFASAATLGQGVLSCDEGFSRKIQEMGSRQERQGPGNRKSGGPHPILCRLRLASPLVSTVADCLPSAPLVRLGFAAKEHRCLTLSDLGLAGKA